MLTDTHCHLYAEAFDEDRALVMARAVEAGVGRILLPNVDGESWAKVPELLAGNSSALCMYPMLGIHPCSVDESWRDLWERMQIALNHQVQQKTQSLECSESMVRDLYYVGIGEIGIDLYWRQDNLALQQEAFLTQVEYAMHCDLPVCIHSRDSLDLILEQTQNLQFRGVYHCYGGNLEQARTIMDRGQYMGIGGTVTFKSNQALRDVLKIIGPVKIVMETDAPYLAPVPYRGKRNEPSMITEVAQCLGDLWGMSAEDAGVLCSRNAADLWGIPL